MVVVMSIFKGWQHEYRQMLLGFEPHVTLYQEEAFEGQQSSDWREVLAAVLRREGVASATPMAQGVVVLDSGAEMEPMEVMGFRPDAAAGLLGRLSKHLVEGGFDLSEDNILITDKMAEQLNVKVGDWVTVNSSRNVSHMVNSLEELEGELDEKAKDAAYEEAYVVGSDLKVAGILRGDTAGERGYLPLHLAQELFGLEDRVTAINLELANPELAPSVAAGLEMLEILPPDWYTGTWQDGSAYLLQSVENQQSLLYFLLLFIVLVAASCVMNTTITVTVQKRREIGILTALGTRQAQVIGIFLAQALVVAVLGVGLGVILGVVVLAWRNDAREWIADLTGKDFFPQDIYFLSTIPSKIVAADMLSICGMALALCVLAALIPAWVAARVDPAVALRD